MYSVVARDKKKRLRCLKFETKRIVLRYLFLNYNLPSCYRHKALIDFGLIPRNSSKVKLRNRCFLTGRSRFVFGSFNLSRLTFRSLAFKGFIPGLKKASW